MKKTDLMTLTVEYREEIETAAQYVDDDSMAVSMKALYPEWIEGILVPAGKRYRYSSQTVDNILYKCLVEHITDSLLAPDIEPEYWELLG